MKYMLTLFLALVAALPATADGKARAAREAAEYVLQRFGSKAASGGVKVLARRIELAAAAHGSEVIQAVRKVGPKALPLVERAGAHSRQVARVLAAHGEHGAVYVVARPRALALVGRHGDQVAAVLVKSRGAAEPVIEALGKPAIGALQSIARPQNARRLAMMAADGGELAKIGRTPELLAVLGRFGDRGMEFVWRHKGALATTAVLAAFLVQPEAFITGAKDITQIVAENAVKPIAETPAIAAKEGAAIVARNTNWTTIGLGTIAAVTLLVAARWRPWRRAAPSPASPPAPGDQQPCR